MSKTIDFIKECGIFYVLTINNNFPAGRPLEQSWKVMVIYLYLLMI
ncbi:hypothetical protein ACQPUL_16230 [Clostridium butyricum]